MMTTTGFRRLILVAVGLAAGLPLAAVIHVYGDNNLYTSDPGGGVPWDHVARVTNATATAVSYGSAVYLGNGYLLTAAHVSLAGGYVTFDGTTTLAIDNTFTPVQVGATADLKIFKLSSDPGLPGVPLFNPVNHSPNADIGPLSVLVGWGVGRDPAQPTPVDPQANVTWDWGSAADTATRRWGTNYTQGATSITSGSYTTDTLYTVLYRGEIVTNQSLDPAHSAVSIYDSGSALFQSHGSNWYLVGVPIAVSTNGSSSFGGVGTHHDPYGDSNFFARVGAYHSDILAIVPEPRLAALLGGLGALVMVIGARRRR